MPIDRSIIGLVSEPRVVEVEKGFLKLFAKAVGETDPVYFDEEAAKAAGHRGILAPPTYVMPLATVAPPKQGNLLDYVDLRYILHGEQQFTHHAPIYGGDVITLVSTVVDVYDKKNGALEFVVQDTAATNQLGELCVEARTVLAQRNPEAVR
jgi:acyl dehydratase